MALMEKIDRTGQTVHAGLATMMWPTPAAGLSAQPCTREIEPVARQIIHVVAGSEGARARLARLIFSLGHHAEVYADAAELTKHAPSQGVIIIAEGGEGQSIALMNSLSDVGLWLPVIGVGDQLSYDTIIAGVKAGVLDFIAENASLEVINLKISACAIEGGRVIAEQQRYASARRKVASLSHREGEVLDMLARGLSNKEMARELSISPRTIEIHRMKMMAKLGAKSSADAIRIILDADCRPGTRH